LKGVLIQNFVENGINNPVLYFPIFYTIQEFLVNGSEGKVSNGLRKYVQNAKEDIPAIWSVWIPAQLVNFGLSPLWFRVPFVALVSAFWTGYVSWTRGGSGKKSKSSQVTNHQ
jgi:protein Mpv17